MIRAAKGTVHSGRSKPRLRTSHSSPAKTEAWEDPYRNIVRRELILCHYCGYSPSRIPGDGVCPKCGKTGWERSVVSRRLVPAQDEA